MVVQKDDSLLVGGKVCFETKAKSQKAVNLRRDPRISFSVFVMTGGSL